MSNFNLNSLKGRIAEQVVQDLFQQSGYNVFNFGLERVLPSLSKLIRTNNHKTGKALRFMPDFVVQSSKNGELFYMEVKFRANGCFSFDENYDDYPYHNAWFVIVSPEQIQCMHYKRLKAGYSINPNTNYSLLKVKSFHIVPQLLEDYVSYCNSLFASFKKPMLPN
jgi:hypothetical protein